MALVGNLFVNLKANTAAFGKGMDRARSKSKSSMSAITGNLKKIGIAAGVMGAAAIAGFALLIKRSADAADKLGKLSEATGISVETLSGLGFAAEQSGIDMDFVAQRMVNLARRAKEADRGIKSYALAFKSLGIELRDGDNKLKATDVLLLEVADAFSRMEDGTMKAALATDIFSNAGVALIPLLNKGAAGIRAMMEEGRIFGQVISTETAIAAQEFNDNLDKLKSAATGVANVVLAELAPSMAHLTEQMADFIKESGGIPALGEKIGKAFETIARGAANIATRSEIAIIALGALGQALFQLAIKGAIFAADEIKEIGGEAIRLMEEAALRGALRLAILNEALAKVGNAAADAGGRVNNFNTNLKETEKKLKTLPPIAFFSEADARVQQLTKNWEKLNAEQAKLKAALAALPLIRPFSEGDFQLLKLIDDMELAREKTAAIEVAAQQMGSSMLAAFDAAIIGGEGFKSILQGLLIDVVRLINRMIFMATVGRLLSSIFGGLFGGFAGGGKVGGGATLSSAAGPAGFQAGGRTPVNAPILVGERGPELFVPDTAGRIVPNESIGGLVINIDARGADASVEMRVRRAIGEAMKQSVELSRLNILDRAQRGG